MTMDPVKSNSSHVCADNPYEQKLYSMFCGHDKEQRGWLTVDALQQLCTTLELKENGTKLIAALTDRCGSSAPEVTVAVDADKPVRITFKAFKEELLHVLGTETQSAMSSSPVTEEQQQIDQLRRQKDQHGGRLLMLLGSCSPGGGNGSNDCGCGAPVKKKEAGDDDDDDSVEVRMQGNEAVDPSKSSNTPVSSPPRSRMSKSVSPTREVAPKLVMGSKKYGRRSRPHITQASEEEGKQPGDRSGSENEEEDDEEGEDEEEQIEGQGTIKVHRSASQTDVKRRRQPQTNSGINNSSTKLKRCASLPARRNMAREFVRIRGSSPNKHVKAQLDSSVESLGNLDVENLSQNLYEIWIRLCSELHANSNELKGTVELEQVFGRAGISMKVAEPLAEEIFDKLRLDAEGSTINFQQFIGLIQTEDNVMYFANNCNNTTNTVPTTVTNPTNRINLAMESKGIVEQDDGGLLDKDGSGYATATSQMTDYQIVPSELIVDMWETAGIQNAMQLLKYDLGFDAEQVNIQLLSQAIDEELSGLRSDCPDDERISMRLMRAALSLNKAELNGLQVALKHLGDENQKLHAGNRDANDRVALMAQEVDERHAAIEKATQMEIRSLEQKHSDSVRELSKQLELDRETWSTQNAALEGRIKVLETEEQRLRTENSRLDERNGVLEAEQAQHQKQLADLLETNIRLNTDICELEEQQNSAAFNRSDRENEEIMELMEKITRLQMENTDLRDRNDELCAELDVLVGELSVWKGRKVVVGGKSTGSTDLEAEEQSDQPLNGVVASPSGSLVGVVTSNGSNNIGAVSQATKRRGDSPSKSKIAEESPRLGKLRKCSRDKGEDGDAEEDEDENMEMPLNAELVESQAKREVNGLKERVIELEALLKEMKTSGSVDGGQGDKKANVDGERKCLSCEEMESSLDLMRKEFDSLEDYWQGKLNEERVLFEDEQRVNDDKFNDLLQKMLEYEEQFSSTMTKKEDGDRDPRLSPIEERGFLEQQYMDLEEELNGLKKILREKNEEIKALRVDAKHQKILPSFVAAAVDPFNISIDATSPPLSPAASSPINYLWSQSTIQAPARDYQNPNWQQQQQKKSEAPTQSLVKDLEMSLDVEEAPIVVSPIQKPKPGQLRNNANNGVENGLANCDKVSVASSNDRHSTATYNVVSKAAGTGGQKADGNKDVDDLDVGAEAADDAPKDLIDAVDAEELSQQQIMLRQLQEDCKELMHRRDALLNELQQLNEMRPQLEKNFARTIHPSLTSRIQQLEQRNRQLQSLLKQHQQYSESLMHQTWQQQRVEISDLRTRLEGQGMTVADQVQRLAKADILVKELFVENSHLRANIQRLEQQTMRNNYLFQQHAGAPPGLNGVPSFP